MPEALIPTAVTLLRPDGTSRIEHHDLPEQPGFDQLCAIIDPLLDGATREHVNVWHDGAYTDLFVGEFSALDGSPRNAAATAIYRANWLTHQDPKADPESLPAIHGPAVLFSRRVWW